MTTDERSRSTASDPAHTPVLVDEVVAHLAPRPDGVYVDCTVGLGGHTAALLAAGAGRVIGIDRDRAALAQTRARLAADSSKVELVHADYRDLTAVLRRCGVDRIWGGVADLGVSSMQVDDPARGFSFKNQGPLDMRMDQSQGPTLADRLQQADEKTLADLIWRFGEERHSRRVARAIVQARDAGRLETTADLASAVRRAAGGGTWQRIDPATRTFQALRIWVNGEIDGLGAFIDNAASVLQPGGRLAVIAFHSLEDREVKHAMRRLAADGVVTLRTRRPVVPGDEEVARNPRARSARLRVLEKAA
jgi:16S rRNA (cytosine1402-N4)-methyltransferase